MLTLPGSSRTSSKHPDFRASRLRILYGTRFAFETKMCFELFARIRWKIVHWPCMPRVGRRGGNGTVRLGGSQGTIYLESGGSGILGMPTGHQEILDTMRLNIGIRTVGSRLWASQAVPATCIPSDLLLLLPISDLLVIRAEEVAHVRTFIVGWVF
jgi:hypothetical protein